MSKVQDGNGSSRENGTADFTKRKPQVKTDITVPEEEDPASRQVNRDPLNDFKHDGDIPYDLNAADVKRLMNEYLAKLDKGLRT